MMKLQVIETIGSLCESISLQSIDKKLSKGCFILTPIISKQSQDLLSKKQKTFYYLVLKSKDNYTEEITRFNQDYSDKLKELAHYCEFSYDNRKMPLLKIKSDHIKNHSDLINDLAALSHMGVLKHTEFLIENGVLKTYRPFKLIQLLEGLYRDLEDKNKFYFRVSNTISEEDFKTIRKKVLDTLKSEHVSIIHGWIYRFCGSEKIIQVTDKDKTFERALHIKKLFKIASRNLERKKQAVEPNL